MKLRKFAEKPTKEKVIEGQGDWILSINNADSYFTELIDNGLSYEIDSNDLDSIGGGDYKTFKVSDDLATLNLNDLSIGNYRHKIRVKFYTEKFPSDLQLMLDSYSTVIRDLSFCISRLSEYDITIYTKVIKFKNWGDGPKQGYELVIDCESKTLIKIRN